MDGNQFFMGTAFAELAALQDEDAVGIAHSGEAVGDDDGCASHSDTLQRALDQGFGLVVDGGSGLVEDQHGRIFEYGTGNRDPLALPTGEFLAAFADDGVVAFGKLHDEIMGFGDFGSFFDLLIGGIKGAVGDILAHRAVEEENILADKTNRAAQIRHLQVAQIMPIEGDDPAWTS